MGPARAFTGRPPRRTPPTSLPLLAILGALGTLAALATGPTAAVAQSAGTLACARLGSDPAPMHLDRHRLGELTGHRDPGSSAVDRPGTRMLECALPATEARLELLPIHLAGQFNDTYPREQENGLRWGGSGLSTLAAGGVRAAWGPFSAAFAPAFAYHANSPFPIMEVERPGSSPYAWAWRPTGIDWPQRFGTDAFTWADPGDSYVRVDLYGVAAGWSTENLRWGPARRNPLLMSATGPGFPHVFLGTSTPVRTWIGSISFEAIWGHLQESDYFDGDSDNDRTLLAGFVAALQPRGLPGLSLGFARSYLARIPPSGLDLGDYITEPYTDILTNRSTQGDLTGENELFSAFARWVFPESQAEVYLEFARDDQWDGGDDLRAEPEHSAAIVAGFQKLVTLGDPEPGDPEVGDPDVEEPRRLRVAVEAASLNFPETHRTGRPEVIFYTHSGVTQGYTHRGQLLGAPIGPSSDAQSVELDIIDPDWVAGVYLERVRYANDIYFQAFADRYTYNGHDVEFTGGLRGAWLDAPMGIEVFGDVAWSGRANRQFIPLTGPLWNTGYEHNVSLQLGASWRPASARTGRAGGPASPPVRP